MAPIFFEKTDRSYCSNPCLTNYPIFLPHMIQYNNSVNGPLFYTHLTSQHFSHWVTFYKIDSLFNMC